MEFSGESEATHQAGLYTHIFIDKSWSRCHPALRWNMEITKEDLDSIISTQLQGSQRHNEFGAWIEFATIPVKLANNLHGVVH